MYVCVCVWDKTIIYSSIMPSPITTHITSHRTSGCETYSSNTTTPLHIPSHITKYNQSHNNHCTDHTHVPPNQAVGRGDGAGALAAGRALQGDARHCLPGTHLLIYSLFLAGWRGWLVDNTNPQQPNTPTTPNKHKKQQGDGALVVTCLGTTPTATITKHTNQNDQHPNHDTIHQQPNTPTKTPQPQLYRATARWWSRGTTRASDTCGTCARGRASIS